MAYVLVWTRGHTLPCDAQRNDITISDQRVFDTVQQAKDHRRLAGELVVDANTLKIITDDLSWMWRWEKRTKKSYANTMVRLQLRSLKYKSFDRNGKVGEDSLHFAQLARTE